MVSYTHPTLSQALISANQTETAAWTPGQHSLNWKSDIYTVSRAQIAGCIISDPNLYPVGGKEFTQEPLAKQETADKAADAADVAAAAALKAAAVLKK